MSTVQTSLLIEKCFAQAELAIQRLHAAHQDKTRDWHAGVNAATTLICEARHETPTPQNFAKRLWALRVLAAMNTTWSHWSSGLAEASSAALHAVSSILPDELLYVAPADAEQFPAAMACEAASAFGYQVRRNAVRPQYGRGAWGWSLQSSYPAPRVTNSSCEFGSATRAWMNACEHALDSLVHPSWEWPRSTRVPTVSTQAVAPVDADAV